jgi:purine nucleosidase
VPRKIILDCDPGHDDALAIMLAHGCPEIELLAITTVAGNQTLDKTTLNARRVCTVAGITDVPVARGCAQPLVRELVTAGHIHGQSGLDGPTWPDPAIPEAGIHAVDLIIDLIMASPGEITLVPTGPLTNVAVALRKEPQIADRVHEVVLMGGSFTRGNTTPAAEFNIYVDPEAAATVFTAPWPVTMVGLDLTHQALATDDVMARIATLATPLSAIIIELLRFYGRTSRNEQGWAAPPVHDPCAVARVAQPALIDVRSAYVAVETAGQLTAGMTVVDFDQLLAREANAQVATTLNFEGFWSLMLETLRTIG